MSKVVAIGECQEYLQTLHIDKEVSELPDRSASVVLQFQTPGFYED